ncbi:MAG: D-alanyl-D-alanine carboxypeptidase family protein [bacterium]|nr:D-alanyl-D-alanine carboxypeptidase family protein [bacterium]
METPSKKILTINISLILIVGLAFWGFIQYNEQRFALIEQKIEDDSKKLNSLEGKYQNQIEDINNKISGAASSLAGVIAEVQVKNDSLTDSLREEFSQISTKVNTLAKLSATDKELLKKYSKNYFLNEHYVPISLTAIDQKYLSPTSGNFQIHSNVLPYLQAMLITANSEGSMVKVQSAYRSFTSQASLKSNNTVVYGTGTANRFSADQGYSEHQLGTTIDFSSESLGGKLPGFDKTSEYQWLVNNAHRFGFVISYPKGNAYYIYEPWHWRFVGIGLATRLHNDNMHFYNLDQRIIDSYLVNIFD